MSSRKRWSVAQIPYEAVFARDNVSPLCIELTEQQIALLLSQTGYLYWGTRYVTETGDKLTDEQLEVIKKAASTLEAILASAEGCAVYTIELVDCSLVLKSDGVAISTVDLSACLAPPVHMAFDRSNCRMMYTQGNIYSPYTGGDWISVIDFDIDALKSCLNPPQQPPKAELVDLVICDIATGTADLMLKDIAYVLQSTLDGLGTFPYPLALEILDAYALNFDFRRVWSDLGLAGYIVAAPIPDQPMIDTLASLEAKVKLAQHFYCSMSLDVDGNIFFNYDIWRLRVTDDFFSVNTADAVLAYVTQNVDGDLMRSYFFAASISPDYLGSDCSEIDCFALGDCASYSDPMDIGLGAQTRPLSATHDYAANGGQTGTLTYGQGVTGGYAMACDYSGSANFTGGFFVDLGLECTVESATVQYKHLFASSNYPTGVDVDYYGEDGTLRHHFHDPVNSPDAQLAYRTTGYAVAVANVRYIAFLGSSSKFSGTIAATYLANPVVEVS